MTVNTTERVTGGTCDACGAIYLVDPTSKNVGEMMVQALGIVAEKLSKDMSDLVAGEDYDDAVLSYDWRTHRSSGISKSFMDGYGRLYIVKAKQKPS